MEFNVNVTVRLEPSSSLSELVLGLFGGISKSSTAKETPHTESKKEEKNTQEVTAPKEKKDSPIKNETKEITDAMLRAIVGPKAKEFGKSAVFEILKEFNVSKVPELEQDQRQLFIDKLNAL